MNTKYELLENDTIDVFGCTLKRIRALRGFICRGFSVKKGDLGGYIESEDNLGFGDGDNSWVDNNSQVCNNSQVYNNSTVYNSQVNNSRVCNNSTVYNSQVNNSRVYNGEATINTVSIETELYHVTISDRHIRIGCQNHTIENWLEFSERNILEMDGKKALVWWQRWKPILKQIVDDRKGDVEASDEKPEAKQCSAQPK